MRKDVQPPNVAYNVWVFFHPGSVVLYDLFGVGYHFNPSHLNKPVIKFIRRIQSKTVINRFAEWAATGRPAASAIAIILEPLPPFILPTTRPLFCRREAIVYKGLSNIDLASFIQIFCQFLGNTLEYTLFYPLLEPAACLVWRIPLW